MKQIKAAVIHQKCEPFQIEELMPEEPCVDEVLLVRIVAIGMYVSAAPVKTAVLRPVWQMTSENRFMIIFLGNHHLARLH